MRTRRNGWACIGAAMLVAACSAGDSTPGAGPSDGAGAQVPVGPDVRASLSAAMSTGLVLAYGDTWQVVADGARVEAGRIRLFYTRRVMPEDQRASGADEAEPDYWNREHVWPVSYGLDGTPARSDVHNLVPTDRTVNRDRGSRYFDVASVPQDECARCRASDVAFEPPAEVQGDVARIAFYMDVRYEGAAVDGVPDLALADEPDAAASRFGRRSTLIRWHCADPVSAEEVQRHEAAARAQGNRNAFVDAPELVGQVYGAECSPVP